MSATTSPYGNSPGRASVPPYGRASARPTGGYRDNAQRDDWPPRRPGGGGDRPGGGLPPGGPNRPYRGRRRPRWGRIALLGGLAVLIIAVIAGISLYGYADNLDKDLKRTDAFSQIATDRPAKPVEGPLNI